MITEFKLTFIKILGLLVAIIFLTQCSDSVSSSIASDINVKTFNIYNFTGHLVRRSGEKCGSALQVEFVLTSPEDRQEYIIDGDRVMSVSLVAIKGQTIRVSAYEINGVERTFLTQRSMTFNPPSDLSKDINPSVVLCPKDQLEFYDFN